MIQLICFIANGYIPILTAGAEDKEEFDKRLETAALAQRPYIIFNNMPNGMVLYSERLAEFATEGIVTIRKLGKHEGGTCDCRATTMFFNGNNFALGGDLVYRHATCRLDTRTEDPGDREFSSKPIEQVRGNRGRYLAAVFTIIRAYKAADAPKQEHIIIAGFEQWSKWVQQPLIWLGEKDPLGNMAALRRHSETEQNLQELLLALRRAFPTYLEYRAFTTASCAEKAELATGRDAFGRPTGYVHPVLRELMTDRHFQINRKAFGNRLTSSQGQMVDGWCVRVSDKEGDSNTYYLSGPKEKIAAWPPATKAAEEPATKAAEEPAAKAVAVF